MCCEFLGEHSADGFVRCPFRGRNGQGIRPGSLELICNPDCNLVGHLVDNIVAVVPVLYRSFGSLIRQQVHQTVLQSHSYNDRTRISGTPLSTLCKNKIIRRGEVCNTEIIGAHR